MAEAEFQIKKVRTLYSPQQIKQTVEQRVKCLNQALKLVEARLSDVPDGTLRISCIRQKTCYYHVLPDSKGNGKYLKRSEKEIAISLSQKDYDITLQKSINAELTLLNRFLEKYTNFERYLPETQYDSLSQARKDLVQRFDLTNEEYRKIWEAYKYQPKPFINSEVFFQNRRNDRVRSKSEVIISNILEDWNIPFRYEAPLLLKNGNTIHPDFTILNVRTRKVYYLEHLGKMDDGSYSEIQMYRISDYQDSGIFLGEQLLITYETLARPFDGQMLYPLIKKYFI